MFRKKKGFYYALIILTFILIFLYWQNYSLQISKYILSYDKLPQGFDGYRIVQISDMHGKTFGSKNSTLAKRIKDLKPDILCVTGDMLSSHVDDSRAFLDFLEEFEDFCPVYMCLGNHEQIVRWLKSNENGNIDYKVFFSEVESHGVNILDNETVVLKKGKDQIWLSGLTIELYHYSRRDTENFDNNLLLKKFFIDDAIGKPAKGFNLLLTHNPVYFDEYVLWGANLTLSGHMHGGVIQVPFKGGLLSPERTFFPKYDAGLFEEKSSKMIVNRGLGYSQINFRLFNRPEISLIELKSE